MTSVLDLNELLKKIPQLLQRLTTFQAFAVYLLDVPRQELSIAYSVGYPEELARTLRLKVGCGLVGAAVAEGKPIRVGDVRDDPRYLEVVPGSHAERMRGAAVGREIDGFNELHRLVFELVSYELRERAPDFFETAFSRALGEEPMLFEGVSVDAAGELDAFALRRNIVAREIARYLAGLDRLLEIEAELARDVLGERKAAIIHDGLMAVKEKQLQRAGKPG